MHDLAALLGPRRTAAEDVLARETSPRSVQRWIATGRLVRLHPGWATQPRWAGDWTVRASAATGYTGGVLSHTSALSAHGLIDSPAQRLDVTVPAQCRLRSTRRLRLHRSRRPCGITIARGLAATSVARALVDTWGDAHAARGSSRYRDLARGSVLRATRERSTTVADIDTELPAVPRLPGLPALRELLDDARRGTQSLLEVLAAYRQRVLDVPANATASAGVAASGPPWRW